MGYHKNLWWSDCYIGYSTSSFCLVHIFHVFQSHLLLAGEDCKDKRYRNKKPDEKVSTPKNCSFLKVFARSSFYENKVLRPHWPPPLEHNELAQSCPDSLGTARPPRRVPWQGLIVRKKPDHNKSFVQILNFKMVDCNENPQVVTDKFYGTYPSSLATNVLVGQHPCQT